MSKPIPTEGLTILDIEMTFVRHRMVGECVELYKLMSSPESLDVAAHISLANGSHSGYRVVYKLCYGDIPEGREVDHMCENRACIRPTHLQAIAPLLNKQLVGIRNRLYGRWKNKDRGAKPPHNRLQG